MAKELDRTPEQERLLQEKYANKFVALCEGEVIASGPSITEVMDRAKKVAKGRKYLVEFIPPGDLLVLKFSHLA